MVVPILICYYSWNNTNSLYIHAICNSVESNIINVNIITPITLETIKINKVEGDWMIDINYTYENLSVGKNYISESGILFTAYSSTFNSHQMFFESLPISVHLYDENGNVITSVTVTSYSPPYIS